jgi:hypothetical protein
MDTKQEPASKKKHSVVPCFTTAFGGGIAYGRASRDSGTILRLVTVVK